jgi:DNA-binding CsgD family transcriptional regulator
MGSLLLLEAEPGPSGQPGTQGALPPQREPRRAPSGPSWPVHTVLVAGPDGDASEALRTSLSQIGLQRILRAGSAAAVRDLLNRGVTGDLATVSARFGADTDPLITALRGGGWRRVMVCAPTGAAERVISAVRAGATGVLTAPGNVFRPPVGAPPAHPLTEREIQVLTLVADGCSNKDIGARLSLSALTVKNHLTRIGRKLGAGDRAQIVALACRAGIIG